MERQPPGDPGRRRISLSRALAAAGDAAGGAVSDGLRWPFPVHPIGLRDALLARLAADVRAEWESGRLGLWLPVLFAVGMLLYFGAEQEPSVWAAVPLTAALAAGLYAARTHAVSFWALAAALAVALGFTVACLQTLRMAHPVLEPASRPVRLTGFVERVEHRATADRILLRVTSTDARDPEHKPDLVRLSLAKGAAPATGSGISQLARVLPPLGPAMPGSHDFGRSLWFQGIDAVGYGLGRPKAATLAEPAPLSVRVGAFMEGVRSGLAARIRQVLSGSPADIAVALVTGDRSAISPAVEESMRLSGLTHVLSISGLHMALVAGTLFALVRGLLALSPALALGFPLKSIAAAVALAGSAFYLALSGNDVPAQRSFIMSAVVLAGILAGRPALTLRSVAVAGVVVLTLAPVSVLEPGTQMSFAATLALVAAYERLKPLRSRPAATHLPARLAMKCAVFFGLLALTSLVAGLATAPFGALHFQRLAPFGLLANLLAMPAVSLLVMPFGLLGVLLLPFGWDALAWPVMGFGIEVMVRVSDFVAALPGAGLRTDVVSAGAAAAAALCLCCLCLLRGSLVAFALVPGVAAILLAGAPPRPDLLIAPDARTVAVRGPDGRLSIAAAGANRMLAEQWLGREGDGRTAQDPDLAGAFTCDALGCVAPLPGGGVIALSRKAESLETDCLESVFLVTVRPPPKGCPADVYAPLRMAKGGTVALFRDTDQWRAVPARDPRVQRPWMPRRAEPPKDSEDPPPATLELDAQR